MPQRLHRFLIPLAALLAILPILLAGPTCGHDFDFHLLNWLDARQQLAHLTYPRWAYSPAYGAGEPRFLFYPPLSWLLGAALTAILPFKLVSVAYTWLCLTCAGLSLRRLAAAYSSPAAATLAAVAYLANPYILFTAYERTAYGELLAAALIPLLLAAILSPSLSITAIAFPLALLWLTNAPAAVMGTYALAFLAIVRLAYTRKERIREATTILAATALGLTLAAFYIVPAAYERRWVSINLVVVTGLRPADNFLFHHTPDAAHDAVLHTASVIALGLLLTTAAVLVTLWLRPGSSRPIPLTSLTLLTAAIAFLLTPLSLLIWTHLPDLAFLQFPWRLLAILTPILCLALAAALTRIRPTYFLAAAPILLALCILPAWQTFSQPCDPEDTPTGRRAAFLAPDGTEQTDEYTPLDADEDALKPGDPPYWLAQDPDAPAPVNATPGQSPNRLDLTLPQPAYLILNRRAYPAWRLRLNGQPMQPMPRERADGLMVLPVPAGHDTLTLSFTQTPDQQLGEALSALAVFGLILIRTRRPNTDHQG